MTDIRHYKKNIEDEWNCLINSEYKLIISTVITKNLSQKWQFFYRNKIIKEIVPPEVKILTLEFDLDFQYKIIRNFKEADNKLTIHGSMISELQTIIPEKTLCLLLDIDAFPLSEEAIKLSFLMASKKGAFGNIQRTNCIKNGENLFIGCSYICFDNKKLKPFGHSNWVINQRSDCGEEISWNFPEMIDEELFRPLKTIFKPIWALEGDIPAYGIGTTFGFNNEPMTYHHFFSRNLVSRVHFFLISFGYFVKIKRIKKRHEKKNSLNMFLKYLKTVIKFTIKYLINKID